MIVQSNIAELAGRLRQAALRLAAAHQTSRQLEARQPASRWRRAALLWPLFGRG